MTIFAWIVLGLIGAVGLTHIVVDGKIFEKIRQRIDSNNITTPIFNLPVTDIVNCHQCCGMYSGFISGLIVVFVSEVPFGLFSTLLFSALMGFASSFCSMLGKALIDYLNMNIGISLGDIIDDSTTRQE